MVGVYASQFEGGEPCSICGHVIADTDKKSGHESVMPTTVVPGFLYLGSYDTASRQELLKAMNISHILNVSMHSVRTTAAKAHAVPACIPACHVASAALEHVFASSGAT